MKTILRITCLVIIAIVITIVSCKKENNNGVPITPVDIYLYTSNPSFFNINVPGGWVYITGGVRGILVYRKSSTDFMAYDRNCTYQSSQPCATVVVDATNIFATDTCCHSKFSILDGSVTHGPAGLPLKQYNTTFDGNVLHIYN
jgi:nitrite reductase/ring-hydroxylating ferredoxin subunit